MHVPSFQAGPRPRPDSDGPDSMITSPIRRASRARPGLGRTKCSRARPAAPHGPAPWSRGPLQHHHHRARPGACEPHPIGNCGRASRSTQQVQARSTGGPDQPVGHGSDRGRNAYLAYGKPLADSGTSPTRGNLDLRVTRRRPQRHESSAGGEGLPQTTPLLSVRGCKWGPTPLSSMNIVFYTPVMPRSKTARDTPEGGS